ncbi:uncharacterized protein LOC131212199 [Anopheles bellator]|uniref:uncharacterized protein LOC131212199 n=1 Tax=Anopheles bellator TaxID=139047 RepID=UPI00264A38C4|nr:uncharacterized protein LOC131212199 [Anopheles bellator]
MNVLNLTVVALCLISTTCARFAFFKRTAMGLGRGACRPGPVKTKRQTSDLHPKYSGLDRYGVHYSTEDSSDESILRLRSKASVAEVLRHRLMACGLITTKSPERWRDRLMSELDEVVMEIEERCALCKSLYDDPYRYEILRSLISPYPACYRKNAKRRLLLALQKALVQSVNSQPNASDANASTADGGNDSTFDFTDVPKNRKTRSTTEIPLKLATQPSGATTQPIRVKDHKFKNSMPHHQVTTGAFVDAPVVKQANKSDNGASPVHLINGHAIRNVHDFLQQYMKVVHAGQPGDEQRKQFFLDQLCRNVTNGRIVLQCKDTADRLATKRSSPSIKLVISPA